MAANQPDAFRSATKSLVHAFNRTAKGPWRPPVLENGMRKLLLILVLVLAAAMPGPALEALSVDITKGTFQPLPIAIPDFSTAGAAGTVGADIAGVVRADLERSGLFRPIDPKAFVDHTGNINTVPNFANWRTINA